MAEQTYDELDFVVMAQVMAGCLMAESLSQNQERMQTHMTFYHNCDRISQKTFLFVKLSR